MKPLEFFEGKVERIPGSLPNRFGRIVLEFCTGFVERPSEENPRRQRAESEVVSICFGPSVDDVALSLERMAARLRTLNGDRDVRAPIDILKGVQHRLRSICGPRQEVEFDVAVVEGVLQDIGDYLTRQGAL